MMDGKDTFVIIFFIAQERGYYVNKPKQEKNI
jgi:hypothetical protein